MAIDPVCNMSVQADKVSAKAEYQGVTYYFCSEHCRQQFVAHPEKYVVRQPSGGHGGHSHGRG